MVQYTVRYIVWHPNLFEVQEILQYTIQFSMWDCTVCIYGRQYLSKKVCAQYYISLQRVTQCGIRNIYGTEYGTIYIA